MLDVTLLDSDPTIWAKCPKCCASYLGKHVGNYFAMAYPRRKAGRTVQEVLADKACENCSTPMQFLYEVK
jgi:hypothetical protein